jgi:hypothetical protein
MRRKGDNHLQNKKGLSARKILPSSTKHTRKCMRKIRRRICNSKTKLKTKNHENE